MDPELRDILGKVADDQVGGPHTHITMYGTQTRWSVKHHNLTAFWNEYCKLVDKKMNGDIPDPYAGLCLAERPQSIMPVIGKFIFKFHDNDEEEDWMPYDDHFLVALVSVFQSVLADNFKLSEEQTELMAVVLESNNCWYEDSPDRKQKFVCWEIRIQFPYAHVDAGLQTEIIYPKVLAMLYTNNVLRGLAQQPIGSWEKMLNSQAANEPLIMYGSGEVPGRPKLVYKHIWPLIEPDMRIPDDFPLEAAFIPNNHEHVQKKAVSEADLFNTDREYLLPLFLSVGYWPAVVFPKEQRQIHTLVIQPQQTPTYNQQRVLDEVLTDLELAERIIPMLKAHRYTLEPYWLDMGKALYKADSGGENGVMTWIRCSERAMTGLIIPNFMSAAGTIAETCRTIYHTFASTAVTVKTLAWYAREDNPDLYANWHRNWCQSVMDKAPSCSDEDVANAFYRQFWLEFIYCPIGKGKWFQFKNHRWHESYQALDLRITMSNEFLKRFEWARANLARDIAQDTNEETRAKHEATVKRLGILIGDLKNGTFKNKLELTCREKFRHDTFLNLLDSNPDLTGVTNGILEAVDNAIIHRSGKPEDYVSMCNNLPYQTSYSWDHPLVVECMEWFEQVYPDPALKHHFLKLAASCLKGMNSDKIFPMMSGNGNNSKSMIVKLFESTFGMYCIKFDFSVVTTRNSNSSGPTPQMARAKSTKIAFIDEPPDDVAFHKELIKRWVGGDSFFARFLNDNGADVKVTFKMFVICNNPPVFANPDQATKDRVKLIPHLSKWVDDAKPTLEEQKKERRFKRNRFFEKRIPILAPAFLWIMTNYFPCYAQEGLVDPPIITESTNTYWRENDMYAQFAMDTIQEVFLPDGSRDVNSRVTLSDIYTEFKTWFKDTFPGTKIPDRSAVKAELSARWGRMQGNGWNGIRIISNDAGVVGNILGGGFINAPVTKPPHGAEQKGTIQLVINNQTPVV